MALEKHSTCDILDVGPQMESVGKSLMHVDKGLLYTDAAYLVLEDASTGSIKEVGKE